MVNYSPEDGQSLERVMAAVQSGNMLIFEPDIPDQPDDRVTRVMLERRRGEWGLNVSDDQNLRAGQDFEKLFTEFDDEDDCTDVTDIGSRLSTEVTSWRLLADITDAIQTNYFLPDYPEQPETLRPDYTAWLEKIPRDDVINGYISAARQIIKSRSSQEIPWQPQHCFSCMQGRCRFGADLGVASLSPTIRFRNIDTGSTSEVVYDIASLVVDHPALLQEKCYFQQGEVDLAVGERSIYVDAKAVISPALQSIGIDLEDALVTAGLYTEMATDFVKMMISSVPLESMTWQRWGDQTKEVGRYRKNPAPVLIRRQEAAAANIQRHRCLFNMAVLDCPTAATQPGVLEVGVQKLEPFHRVFGELRSDVEALGAKLAYMPANLQGDPAFLAVELSDRGERSYIKLGEHDRYIRVALHMARRTMRDMQPE
ncbi:MAG TPA: hypothetical protein VF733_06150 [Candidatus Saccharimonadales bacterium]